MNSKGMLVEIVPARVQVALELVHVYATPYSMPVPLLPGSDVQFQRQTLSKSEAAARDRACEVLVKFLAGEHVYTHAIPPVQLQQPTGPGPGGGEEGQGVA